MKNFLVSLIPASLCGALVHFLATRRSPRFLVDFLIRRFRKAYAIDPSLAIAPEGGYQTLQDFFLREPTSEARPANPDPALLLTPVEALVSQAGPLEEDTFLVVKGQSCSLADLAGPDIDIGKYRGGLYAILYLSPADFHRIYAPADAKVLSARLIPGAKKPVFVSYVKEHPEVFIRNQRVVTELQTEQGRVLLAKVGALNVGNIATQYPVPCSGEDPAPRLARGREMARFEFGSTVVLALERDRFAFLPDILPGRKLRLGEALARPLP